jgi:acyl-coenzyme A synthetase/AMP-(fatty) acid ligase
MKPISSTNINKIKFLIEKINKKATLWDNEKLFEELYFKKYPGYYDTADIGFKCENGFINVSSRADDVINVAGHRLSSTAIEEVYFNIKYFILLVLLNQYLD